MHRLLQRWTSRRAAKLWSGIALCATGLAVGFYTESPSIAFALCAVAIVGIGWRHEGRAVNGDACRAALGRQPRQVDATLDRRDLNEDKWIYVLAVVSDQGETLRYRVHLIGGKLNPALPLRSSGALFWFDEFERHPVLGRVGSSYLIVLGLTY